MGLHCCLPSFTWYLSLFFSAVLAVLFALRYVFKYRKQRQQSKGTAKPGPTVAFFHPYCNAGGGGERVLWCAIQSLQEKYPNVNCVVYTGDLDASSLQFLSKAKDRFGLTLSNDIEFVYLKRRRLVEARLYPFFTLLGQSIGGLVLGFEALCLFVPDILVDSMGYPFVPPLFRYLAGCQTASYVHYPTISTDMLTLVREMRHSYNNPRWISNNYFLSTLKLLYYKTFASIYGFAGRANHLIMANSTWTYGHIIKLWCKPQSTTLIYPPCDIDSLTRLGDKAEKLLQNNRQIRILSLGQFRPEKNHRMQIVILAFLLNKAKRESLAEPLNGVKITLVLAGGCRHEEDEKRVLELKKFADQLNVGPSVDWRINVNFDQLKAEFETALIGLHTMKNEHFGMAVVESMAAGLITVANNSAGPKWDIIRCDGMLTNGEECARTGFLASEVEQYANLIWKIIRMSPEQRQSIRENARESCQRFSDQKFKNAFLHAFRCLLV